MGDSNAQRRFRDDALMLALIGAHLAAAELARVEISLPAALAEVALAAWNRTEESAEDAEDLDQRIQRHRAASLALIGAAIADRGQRIGDQVIVALHPALLADALNAADDIDYPDDGTGGPPSA